MLPDFKKVKKELSASRATELSSNLFADPVLSKIRHYRQHEGDRFTIFRDDGSHTTSSQKLMRSELITFEAQEIQARGERVIYESIEKARSEIAIQGRRLVSEKLEEEPVPKVDAGGRPFTAELYLESLEAMELQFDRDGTWKEPDVWQEFPNPRMKVRIEQETERFDREPDLKQRLDSLLSRKRQEFNDREANRKLVD
jgi:hypothetical protein